jgi:hypothetical protein
MFELVNKIVEIGSEHRAGNRLPREGIRKQVFNWLMDDDDFDVPIAHVLGRRTEARSQGGELPMLIVSLRHGHVLKCTM